MASIFAKDDYLQYIAFWYKTSFNINIDF